MAVESILWIDIDKMEEVGFLVYIKCFARNSGRYASYDKGLAVLQCLFGLVLIVV